MIFKNKLFMLLAVLTWLTLVTFPLTANQEIEISGTIEIRDQISTIITAEDTLNLYVISPELSEEGIFPPHSEEQFKLTGYRTETGLIIYEILTDAGEEYFKDSAGKTLMVSTSPELSYSVDRRRCISCRLCIEPCPVGAISMNRGAAVIDKELCISCGICLSGNALDFEGCPVGAVREEKVE